MKSLLLRDLSVVIGSALMIPLLYWATQNDRTSKWVSKLKILECLTALAAIAFIYAWYKAVTMTQEEYIAIMAGDKIISENP